MLERGEDMVLAAHFTDAGGLVATTIETVRFEPPSGVHFRLARGPVPHVVEQFVLNETITRATRRAAGRRLPEAVIGRPRRLPAAAGRRVRHRSAKRPRFADDLRGR